MHSDRNSAKHEAFDELVELFARLPGIGKRTATRLTFFVLGKDAEYARAFGRSLEEIHEKVKPCKRCGNYGNDDECLICKDPKRDTSLMCIVASVQDLMAIERSGSFRGRYHVLHRLLAPLDGVGPDALPTEHILTRIKAENVSEVILATPLTVEGEATALFLSEIIQEHGVSVSRLAAGMPHGGELEYADQITLGRALEGRKAVGG